MLNASSSHFDANPDMRPLATPSLGLKGGFWAAREYLERQKADW
jgi:hypothetical protein